MNERLEPWLNRTLAVLVIASLFLTSRIWVGSEVWTTSYEPYNPTPEKREQVNMAALIAPQLMVAHTGQDTHLGLLPGTPDYAAVWRQGKAMSDILGAATGVRRDPVTAQELLVVRQEGPSLEFDFEDGYRLTGLARIFGAATLESDLVVDRIIVHAGRVPVAYVRTQPRLEYLALNLRADAIDLFGFARMAAYASGKGYTDLADQIVSVRVEPGTFVPKDPQMMARMPVLRDPTGVSAILSTFFVDVSLLRRIEERDGALTYSDGKRGVRIYPSGAVDYGQPQAGGEVERLAAIEQAAAFAMEHGGLPGTAYVDRIVLQKGKGGVPVRFDFRYEGIPVTGSRGVIEVLVGSKGAESFLRNFRLPTARQTEPQALISPREALDAVSAARGRLFVGADPGPVIGMHIAYLNGAPEESLEPLKPVWDIEFRDGWALTVDALTGAAERRVAP